MTPTGIEKRPRFKKNHTSAMRSHNGRNDPKPPLKGEGDRRRRWKGQCRPFATDNATYKHYQLVAAHVAALPTQWHRKHQAPPAPTTSPAKGRGTAEGGGGVWQHLSVCRTSQNSPSQPTTGFHHPARTMRAVRRGDRNRTPPPPGGGRATGPQQNRPTHGGVDVPRGHNTTWRYLQWEWS